MTFTSLAGTASVQPVESFDMLGSALSRTYGVSPDAMTASELPSLDLDASRALRKIEIDAGTSIQTVVPVSELDTYMVQFQPSATLPEVQRVLAEHGLRVADQPEKNQQLSRIGALIVERVVPETESTATVDRGDIGNAFSDPLVLELRADPLVSSAVPDLVISTENLPRNPDVQPDGSAIWDWNVVDTCVPALDHPPPSGLRDGNWGLKAARFPAAWRLVGNRLQIDGREPQIKAAVLDAGFEANDDLEFELSPLTRHSPHNHGTHVAGIIGATFDNQLGIDGASPWVKILAVPHARQQVDLVEGDIEEQVIALQSDIVATLIALLQEPGIRVINVSLGYNWKKYGIDPGNINNASIRNDISNTGIMLKSVLGLAAQEGILFVSAAGNDSSLDSPEPLHVDSRWASPLNWAALDASDLFPVDNAIVVEAFNRRGARATFSNRGAHVSAPGTDILSTIGGGFAVDEGTSMAAPHVTALATLLVAYDPTIAPDEIARAIRDGARPVASGGAPQIDALGALVAYDSDALRYLADLNLDGEVGPADFAIFKDQWQKLHGVVDTVVDDDGDNESVVVDAVTSSRAPAVAVDDFNGNGVTDFNEKAWPLIDLNGSGLATDNDCDLIELGGKSMTDLDVMGEVWTDADTPFDSLAADLCSVCTQH